MRKKRNIVLTKEQIEFRDKILKVRPKIGWPKREEKPPIPAKKIISRNEYMNNCMFWINEYEAGKTDKTELYKSVFYLRHFCEQIIKELTTGNELKIEL